MNGPFDLSAHVSAFVGFAAVFACPDFITRAEGRKGAVRHVGGCAPQGKCAAARAGLARRFRRILAGLFQRRDALFQRVDALGCFFEGFPDRRAIEEFENV